ncbi:electron transfer flavoprotein subunit alpha [Brenneria roseae subsp. roseae]|uniref:FAD-binding protein n=1 Tax=Brenneria roseae TaxID=1509241 RepID=UPI000D617CF4|nr:FAD-binding protein [Brenneria roseae]PWC17937.1 electron transfer flavoprotein subunit alpha [Brenneria roseae subsp. roseae]
MANLLPIVFVYADKADRLAELIVLARQWGKEVNVLFVGDDQEIRECINLGADVVYHFAQQEDVIIEDYVPSFVNIIREVGPQALVLLAATKRCKAIAAHLGQQLNAAVVNDMLSLRVENSAIFVTHQFYGGLAHETEQIHSPYAIVTTSNGGGETEYAGSVASSSIKPGVFIPPTQPIRLVSRRPKQGSMINLTKAKRVVGIGRGFSKQEDIALAEALAKAIHGEVGCSRPIAEGEGWMEHGRYIGVSGVALNADLYIATGVSGQIQHMVGVNHVKTIVAINKDKNAPIFNFVDYGIVGDLYKVLPTLTAKLNG